MGGTKSGLVARHQACWPMKVSVRNVTALFAGDCFFFRASSALCSVGPPHGITYTICFNPPNLTGRLSWLTW